MKQLIFLTLCIFHLSVFAQNSNMYVALKTGLSMRDKPTEAGKVIGKIPYATKVNIATGATTEVKITTEGFNGYWTKVTYGQLTGYVVSSYLISVLPPRAGTKTMKEYLLQLTSQFGSPLILKSGNMNNIAGGGYQIKKQLYKNGILYNEHLAYEYSAESCFIPNLAVAEAFLLARLIPEFELALPATEPFPVADKKYKRNNIDYELKVEKEMIGAAPWIKKIHIEFSDGSFNTLEIYQIEGEAVISYSSGV
jgi:hypothetical protein